MRKALLIISLITGILSSSLLAQTIEIEWGGSTDLPKNTRFNKIIGQDSNKFYMIRSEKDKDLKNSPIWLESFDKTSSGIESSYQIEMPKIYTKKSRFEDIYYINNKLVLFCSVVEPIKQRNNLYAFGIDEDGITNTEPLLIGSISSGLDDDLGFKFMLSPDKKKVIVTYHITFSTYNGEPFHYKVIDSDLKLVETKEFEMPFLKKKFEILDFQRGESGNYYFAVRVEPLKKGRSNPRAGRTPVIDYSYTALVFNSAKNIFQPYNIVVDKYKPAGVSMTIDEDENILLFGFGTKRSSLAFGGVYYMKINPRIEKIISSSFLDFYKDRAFMQEFKQERNGLEESQWYSYTKGKVKFLDNGSKIFISEQYYVTTRTIVDPSSKDEMVIYYYNYNDMIVCQFDEDDKPGWYRRIPKNQYSTNDKGYYSSYAITIDVNKIKLIYNDHSRNLKNKDIAKTKEVSNNINTNPDGMAVLTTIYNDGNVDKAAMFPKSDSKVSICPKFFIESGSQYFIYGQDGSEYKFGNFFFD